MRVAEKLFSNLALKCLLSVGLTAAFCAFYVFLQRWNLFPVTEMSLTRWDRFLPFVPGAVYFYASLVFLNPVGPWLAKSKADLFRYARGLMLISAVGFGFFFFFPTAMPRPETGGDVNAFYAFLVKWDTPLNAFPSLHAALAVFSGAWCRKSLGPNRWVWIVWVWVVGIIVSALLTKQHTVLDVAGGSLLGWTGFALTASENLLRLPWVGKFVPRGLVDVIRGCNISCRACYNSGPKAIKPPAKIEEEVNFLLSRRRVSAMTIIGGEVLLHPRIDEIVRRIKQRGVFVELCTNGLLLDDAYLGRLKEAGLDIIYLHVEQSQTRADLPADADLGEVSALREKIAARMAGRGIDAGLLLTACRDNLAEFLGIVEETIRSPYVNYLLVTLHRDHANIRGIQGDLDSGLRASFKDPRSLSTACRMSMEDAEALLNRELNLSPFAFIGSNLNPADRRWLSYLVGVVTDASGAVHRAVLRASGFERLVLFLVFHLTGKYPSYLPQNPLIFRIQIFFNALSGGSFVGNLKLLAQSFRPGSVLLAKRILIQNPAEVLEDGRVVHCEDCPDAVPKEGRLVPVCLCDLVSGD